MLGAALAACSSIPTSDATVLPACSTDMTRTEYSDDIGELMRYAESIRLMNAEAQRLEYQRVEARFLEHRAVTDRFMLALLMSTPESTVRSDVRARELLSEYVQGNLGDDNYLRFAQFLLRGLNDRRSMEQALDTERRQASQLRKQLEELKAIEQHIDNRDQVKEQRGSP